MGSEINSQQNVPTAERIRQNVANGEAFVLQGDYEQAIDCYIAAVGGILSIPRSSDSQTELEYSADGLNEYINQLRERAAQQKSAQGASIRTTITNFVPAKRSRASGIGQWPG